MCKAVACSGKHIRRVIISTGIKEATGLRIEVLKEVAQDRKKWREMVEEKTKNRERTNVYRTEEEPMATHS
jgi:hypothetical protein